MNESEKLSRAGFPDGTLFDPTGLLTNLISDVHLVYQTLETLPIPIEIFSADGLCIYVNEESMKMVGNTNRGLQVGIYDFKNDPVCIEIIGQDGMDRIFSGETYLFEGFPAPIQDVHYRGVIDTKPWEAANMNLYFQPLWNEGRFVCTICYFFINKKYQGKTAVAQAQEYLERNWQADFDAEQTAHATHVSTRQLYNLFKKHLSMTPHQYYKQVKVEHLKESLSNTNVSVKEAFAACGVDSQGTYARTFKDLIGMSPTQYRKALQ